MHRGELLKLHLEGADLLIEAATEGLDCSDLDPSLVSNKLTSAVLIMQQTILDVHFLFFRALNADSTSPSGQGLLSVYQEALLKDIEHRLQRVMRDNKGPFFNMTAFADDNRNKCSMVEARSVFDSWVQGAVQKVGNRSNKAQEAMTSATDVARLQQRVWLCSTTVGKGVATTASGSDDQGSSQDESYTQLDWEAACADLLLPTRRRVAADKKAEAAASTLLWSTVFRAPFVRQVERLLRDSCKALLSRLKAQIINALAAEGLAVDSNLLTVTPGHNALQVASGGPAPSPRIFRRTEAIRSLFESEVTDFVADIVLPVQEGDPESAVSLSQALLVQCSQLAGQVAILIRVLTNACNTALDARMEQPATSSTSLSSSTSASASSASASTNNDAKVAATEAAARNALMTGLLVLGRLASLLKIRGRFLEEALSPLPPKASTTQTYRSCDFTSEEQLRSAFEIADTDGDGVVTYHEALEALQALAVGDSSSSSSDQPATVPFFTPTTTPSLTFDEFTLLCAHLLPPDVCKPADRLRSCLETTVSTSHSKWAEKLVQELGWAFNAQLRVEFGLESMILKKKEAENAKVKGGKIPVGTKAILPTVAFKACWQQASVEVDDSVHEKLLMPSSVSSSVASFLFRANQLVSTATLSIDTIQELPPLGEAVSDGAIAKLASFAAENVNGLVARSIATAYTNLLRDIVASAGSSVHGSTASWIEDCSMQAVFDLLFCESVIERCGVPIPRPLSTCLAGWKGKMDPINAELLAPLLAEGVKIFSSKTHLLFPGRTAPPKAKAPGGSTAITTGLSAGTSDASSASVFFAPHRAGEVSRFGLLPMPISTHAQGAWAKEKGRIGGAGSGGAGKGSNKDDGSGLGIGRGEDVAGKAGAKANGAKDSAQGGIGKLVSNIGQFWGST